MAHGRGEEINLKRESKQKSHHKDFACHSKGLGLHPSTVVSHERFLAGNHN